MIQIVEMGETKFHKMDFERHILEEYCSFSSDTVCIFLPDETKLNLMDATIKCSYLYIYRPDEPVVIHEDVFMVNAIAQL